MLITFFAHLPTFRDSATPHTSKIHYTNCEKAPMNLRHRAPEVRYLFNPLRKLPPLQIVPREHRRCDISSTHCVSCCPSESSIGRRSVVPALWSSPTFSSFETTPPRNGTAGCRPSRLRHSPTAPAADSRRFCLCAWESGSTCGFAVDFVVEHVAGAVDGGLAEIKPDAQRNPREESAQTP